jgi:hypothetical protein
MTAAVVIPAPDTLPIALAFAARGWPVIPLCRPLFTSEGKPLVRKDGTSACTHDVLEPDRKPKGSKTGNPCDGPGKQPHFGASALLATTDIDTIKGWWAKAGESALNYGLAMGHERAAIDVDSYKGGDEGLAALKEVIGPLPDTVEFLTGGGGRHLVFQDPVPGGVGQAAPRLPDGKVVKGIDVRSRGGYIVGPGSVHQNGRLYEIEVSSNPLEGVLPARLPDALIERLRATANQPLVENRENGARIPIGERKKTFVSLAGTMWRRGMSEEAIVAALLITDANECEEPLGEREVRRITKTVTRKPRDGKPKLRVVESEETTPPAEEREPGADDDAEEPDWRDGLQLSVDRSGRLRNTFANLCAVLRFAPEYRGKLSYNEMTLRPVLDEQPVSDGSVGKIREQIELNHRFSPEIGNLHLALLTVAEEKRFHPVRKYLESLQWDGVERIAKVAQSILGIENPTALDDAFIRCWFISAVARALRPGCKVDTALVLVGPQGSYKSTFFRLLAGEWFGDSHMDITNKDSLMQLASAWIYEWSEIESVTTSKQAGEVKKFVTSESDLFRRPFARAVERVLRTSIIVGTTNEERFLNDETGSRRFWILRVKKRVERELLKSWRDQLWAEAVHAFHQNEPWWLEASEEGTREARAEAFSILDPWHVSIERWLISNPAENYTANEIMQGALSLRTSEMHSGAARRVGRCMRSLGFEHVKMRIQRGETEFPSTWVWTIPGD